jgi:hypothetical protein
MADGGDGDRQQHAHDAETIPAPRRGLGGEAAQAQNEKYACD